MVQWSPVGATGREKLARRCEVALEKADAFLPPGDNCPHSQPNFLFHIRRLPVQRIERTTNVVAR